MFVSKYIANFWVLSMGNYESKQSMYKSVINKYLIHYDTKIIEFKSKTISNL